MPPTLLFDARGSGFLAQMSEVGAFLCSRIQTFFSQNAIFIAD
jgi:hypothetical protein